MANRGKIVIVAALDGTFQRKAFGSILELVPLAEEVTKLNSVCTQCGNDASFSKRIGNEKEVEVIGGADKYVSISIITHQEIEIPNDYFRYVAVCRQCFFKPNINIKPGESPTKFVTFSQKSPEKGSSTFSPTKREREELRVNLFGK